MTQPDFQTWLDRKPKGRAPRRPIRKRTPARAKQERQYNARVKVWLKEHPVCEVWCHEKGWRWASHSEQHGAMYQRISAPYYLIDFGSLYLLTRSHARASTQCHHRNKRRGAMLLDERYWLAVCDENHKRIEENKSWARANGFLLNF